MGVWVPSMQPITPGNPKIYQIDWLVPRVSKLYDIALNWEYFHDVSCERFEGWEYCLDKFLMVQRNGNAQTGTHQGMIKHPIQVWWLSDESSTDRDSCRVSALWHQLAPRETDTPCLPLPSVCRLQLKSKLRVSWSKPASEQVSFTE